MFNATSTGAAWEDQIASPGILTVQPSTVVLWREGARQAIKVIQFSIRSARHAVSAPCFKSHGRWQGFKKQNVGSFLRRTRQDHAQDAHHFPPLCQKSRDGCTQLHFYFPISLQTVFPRYECIKTSFNMSRISVKCWVNTWETLLHQASEHICNSRLPKTTQCER